MARRSSLAVAPAGVAAALACALACALAVPAAVPAQEPPNGPGRGHAETEPETEARGVAWRIDVEPFYATATVLWPTGAGWAVGPQVGAGVDEPVTLLPDGTGFSSLLHAGVMTSRPVSGAGSVQAELRVGLGDRLTVCPDSDCLPVGYGALLVGGAVGWRRLRFGTRVGVARVRGETVATWSPVYVRLRF